MAPTRSPGLWLIALLLVVALGTLTVFQLYTHMQQQQVHSHISRGGMSVATKEHFLKLGVDCHAAHEVQGNEAADFITRLSGLTQQELHQLNPGLPLDQAELTGGQVVCIRGVWGVSSTGPQWMVYLWPLVAVGAALLGFVGSQAIAAMRQHAAAPIASDIGTPLLTGSAA